MRKSKKSEKYKKIIQLMLQELPTDEIAKQTGYSIGYIRKVFEELRTEYGVNSKVGIIAAYLTNEMRGLYKQMEKLISLSKGVK